MTLKKVHVYKSVLEKILREHNTDFSSVSEKLGYEKSFISVMFYEGGGVSAQMPIPFVISMSNLLAVKYEAFLEVPRYDEFLGMDRVMKMFFDDCLVVNNSSFPKPRTERLKLYRRYETFCDDEGITPKSRNAFYAFLRERFREVKLSGGRYFEGVAIKGQDTEQGQECEGQELLCDITADDLESLQKTICEIIAASANMLHNDLRALLAEWKPKEPKEPKYAIKEREQP